MTRAEEQRLIRAAAAGDRDAAGTLIRRHQGPLYAYLLRMSGRPELAEDVAQDSFVRVLTNLDRFDPRFRFSTWLFTIARRVFLNVVQRSAPAYDSDLVGRAEGACGVGGERRPVEIREHAAGVRDTVQAGLMRLTLAQREVIVLFHLLDWPIWLIAQHLSLPEGTVKSHLHRGRNRLRDVLKDMPGARDRALGVPVEVHAGREVAP